MTLEPSRTFGHMVDGRRGVIGRPLAIQQEEAETTKHKNRPESDGEYNETSQTFQCCFSLYRLGHIPLQPLKFSSIANSYRAESPQNQASLRLVAAHRDL